MPYAPDLSGSALDDRYELHAVIGEGAFGRVYQGRDRRLARPVAVKVIKPWWTEDPDWVATFERETQLLARVSDPGIVQIFDVGHAPEGLYYVSELIDGENLAERLRRGRLAPWQACVVATQLCRALAKAHAQRIVHRDVKPANILISREGRVKVGDFGVARLAEGSTDGSRSQPPTIVGTPKYMAPEQGRGLPTTPATDVYSVGVVLYEMLAGRPPFTGDSVVELALCHLRDAPPPLSVRLPSSLVEIVERALAKDPAERYADGGEMAGALVDARRASAGRPRGRVIRARSRAATHRPVPRSLTPAETSFRPAAPGRATAAPGRATAAPGRATADTIRPRAWAPRSAAAPVGPPPRPDDTRAAPQMFPRRNVNPPARRRAAGALALVLALLGALVAGALAMGGTGHTRVPALAKLTRAAATATAARRHLDVVLVGRGYSASAPRGTVIGQHPRAGTRVADGSAVRVVLSRGPAPVVVPTAVHMTLTVARARLRGAGLGATVTEVPAPGVSPGTVLRQSAAPGRSVPAGFSVALSVAEVPQWRPLTSFADARPAVVQIRGTRWRLVYRMAYQGTCTFIVFCSGPGARIVNLANGSTVDGFGLSDGTGQTRVVSAGPGRYAIRITPGSDDARWSVAVEDYF